MRNEDIMKKVSEDNFVEESLKKMEGACNQDATSSIFMSRVYFINLMERETLVAHVRVEGTK